MDMSFKHWLIVSDLTSYTPADNITNGVSDEYIEIVFTDRKDLILSVDDSHRTISVIHREHIGQMRKSNIGGCGTVLAAKFACYWTEDRRWRREYRVILAQDTLPTARTCV